MMREFKALFLLTIVLLSVACSRIDEVDINSFNQPDGEVLNGTVAVFGNVTTEMRQHRVTISPVHQWGDNQNVLPEINRVFVLCGNDTIPYIEKEADRNKMVFVSEQPFKGEAGKTYKLVVETPTGDITAEDYLTPLGNTDYFQIIQDHTKVRSYQMQSGKMAHEFQFDKHIYTVGEQPMICSRHGRLSRPKRDFHHLFGLARILHLPVGCLQRRRLEPGPVRHHLGQRARQCQERLWLFLCLRCATPTLYLPRYLQLPHPRKPISHETYPHHHIILCLFCLSSGTDLYFKRPHHRCRHGRDAYRCHII